MPAISPEDGLLAVNAFLQRIWEQERKVGDLGFFCDIISYEPGDGTADPAMWTDWLAAAKMILTGERISDRASNFLTSVDVSSLTPEQAYQAMFKFIEEYWLRISRPPELGALLSRMRYTPEAGTADPAMWQLWLSVIDEVTGPRAP